MGDNRCRYCGYTIVWIEGQGWLRHMLGTIMPQTNDCPSRHRNPSLGHALEESLRMSALPTEES